MKSHLENELNYTSKSSWKRSLERLHKHLNPGQFVHIESKGTNYTRAWVMPDPSSQAKYIVGEWQEDEGWVYEAIPSGVELLTLANTKGVKPGDMLYYLWSIVVRFNKPRLALVLGGALLSLLVA